MLDLAGKRPFLATPMRILAILVLTLAMAAAPPVAKPVGPWVVDFEPTHCIASHTFDAGGKSLIVGIEALPAQESRYLYFQRAGNLRTMEYGSADVRVGGKRTKARSMLGVPVIQKGNVRYLLGLDAGEYRGLLEGSPLSIRSGPVKAEFPPMSLSAVEAQLQNCTSLMLERWGMSREDQSKLASFPKLKPKPIERAKAALSGYPDSAAQRGAMGSVRMLVNVDAAGQISGCRVMRSSGHADLDSDACTALRTRMQFDPAVDRQGRKVASLFVADFRYIVLVF